MNKRRDRTPEPVFFYTLAQKIQSVDRVVTFYNNKNIKQHYKKTTPKSGFMRSLC